MASFVSQAWVIGLCILASRILGMFRDILSANYFGAGLVWDAFVIAFIIPNLFRRLFGEGALSASFIPVFVTNMKNSGQKEAFSVLNRVFSIITLVMVILIIVGICLTFLLPLIFSSLKLKLICALTRIMLPYMFFICGTAILGAALNSMYHFFAPAFAPVILNVCWILALVCFINYFGTSLEQQIMCVAVAVLIGGALEFLLQIPPLLKRNFRFEFIPDFNHKSTHEVASLFLPMVFGLAVVQINLVIDNMIAECLIPGDGAVSALHYANRLMQLPLAVIGTTLATAVFPFLSSAKATEDTSGFIDTLKRALRMCIFITVPASIGLIVLSQPIIRVIYERGHFTPENTLSTAYVLISYSFGLWCYSCNQIFVKAFYSLKDTSTPVKIASLMVPLNLILNLILVFPLKEAGIALSTSICGFLNFLWLLMSLQKSIREINFKHIWSTLLKSVIVSACMGVVCVIFFFHLLNVITWEIVRLLICIVIAAASYIVISMLFKFREAREIVTGFAKSCK